MVRRGSTVRVRQRASTDSLQIGQLACPVRKRLSRAGTRGHALMFPRYTRRHTEFGSFKRFRTASDPLSTANSSAVTVPRSGSPPSDGPPQSASKASSGNLRMRRIRGVALLADACDFLGAPIGTAGLAWSSRMGMRECFDASIAPRTARSTRSWLASTRRLATDQGRRLGRRRIVLANTDARIQDAQSARADLGGRDLHAGASFVFVGFGVAASAAEHAVAPCGAPVDGDGD